VDDAVVSKNCVTHGPEQAHMDVLRWTADEAFLNIALVDWSGKILPDYKM